MECGQALEIRRGDEGGVICHVIFDQEEKSKYS